MQGISMEAAIDLCTKIDALAKKVLREEIKKGKEVGKNRKPLVAKDSKAKSQIDAMVKSIASQIDVLFSLKNSQLYVKSFTTNQSGYLRSKPMISISQKPHLNLSDKEMYILISFGADGLSIIYTQGYEKLQKENDLLFEDVKLILRRAVDFYFKSNAIKINNNFHRDTQGIDVLRKKISVNDINSDFFKDLTYIIKLYLSRENEVFDFVSLNSTVSKDDPLVAEGADVPIISTRRKGQALFKEALVRLWGGCSVTGCKEVSVLRASHVKPWVESSPKEKTDPMNGLLLTPNYDALFDKFLISFDKSGKILVSTIINKDDLKRMGINVNAKVKLNNKQHEYMAYHRSRFFGEI